MRNTKSVAFPHVSLARTATHVSRVAHIAVERQRRHSCVSLWLYDGEREKKRKKEGESSCWWGWTEPLQRHTDGSLWKERITCARLLSCHILIPGREPTSHPSTQHRAPTAEPPPAPQHTHTPHSHSALQLSALPPLCCCSLVSGTHSQTHTHIHTLSPKPPQQLACLMSVKNTRWGG